MATTKTGPSQPFTQSQIDDALTAMIAFAGNVTLAIRYLKQEGKRAPSPTTLNIWAKTTHWQRYEELRETYSQKVEQTIANDMRDATRAAVEVQRLAIEKTKERLEAGKDDDPARSAANLSHVSRSATDKMLALLGRPSQITETRDATEILRSLVTRHPQLFQLTAEEDDEDLELPEAGVE